MLKVKYFGLLLMVLSLGLVSCDDDPEIGDVVGADTSYSSITITPEKDVYQVGDVITCSITELSGPNESLQEETYWWNMSWWSPNAIEVDFQEFVENGENRVNTSSEITLTEPGEITVYFFGQIKYPNFDWRKVEITKKITVVE